MNTELIPMIVGLYTIALRIWILYRNFSLARRPSTSEGWPQLLARVRGWVTLLLAGSTRGRSNPCRR
jgi:hypothetical protein